MKKIAIALSVLMVVFLTACGTPSPTKVSESFLEAIKTQDAEAMSKVYVDPNGFSFSSKEIGDEAVDDAEQDDSDIFSSVSDDFNAKLLDYDYEVTDEKIDGDKATVKVKITTYEFGKELTTFFNNYISQGMMLMFDADADAKLKALEESLMQTMVDNLKEKTYTGEATMNLVKTKEGWKVDKIDDEGDLVNVLSGNSIKAIDTLEDIWE